MNKQVGKGHYDFNKYCYPDRWSSYYCQLREVLNLAPDSILEVGVGDGLFKSYIQKNTGISYKNIDIADDLNPDIIGSVDKIPLQDSSVDLVCAFEVLEHLPFEKFEDSLLEMKRVAKEFVVISLPHFGPPIKINFKIPFLPEFKFLFKFPYPMEHKFNGQHYWEIGKSGYPPKRIKNIFEKHFKLIKDFVPFESSYHHFYILKK